VTKLMPKESNRKQITTTRAAENGVPSMSDVLVGLSSIKLKSANIARSPGGTPLKVKSTNQEPSHDPGNIIASALRKKFASVRRSIGSPLEDKENQWSPHGGFSPSPIKDIDTTAFLPISSSPEKGRKSRRRSSILTGNRVILSPVSEN